MADGDATGRPAKDTRSIFEVLHPDETPGGWRELPGLVRSSFALVWAAGRREFLITASIQLATALSLAGQLLVVREVLDRILGAGDFGDVLPWLLAILGVMVVLDFARTIEREQTEVLGELVSRRALDRVIDAVTVTDLLAFEDPEFHDRVVRAQMQGSSGRCRP